MAGEPQIGQFQITSAGGTLDPVSSLPGVIAVALALATAFLLARRFGAPPVQGRFSSIDGLRGFLAFFVYLHHSCIWYFYLHTGRWVPPPSNLYTHFGESSVALFFMITGFLFFSKLLDERERKIDWLKLYVSRFLRLVPLYFSVMTLLFITVFALSKGTLREPLPKLIVGITRWLGFTIFGGPPLNGVNETSLIVASVTWSLPYEWVFYFLLPLMAVLIRVRPPLVYFGASVVGLGLIFLYPNYKYLIFLGGVFAALLVRLECFCKIAVSKSLSVVAIACLAAAVAVFPTAYQVAPMMLIAFFFIIVAAGNSLFGLLNYVTTRTLGEYSYGIYLTHGFILFVTFNFFIGLPESRHLSVLEFWSVIAGISPVLVLVCFLAYRFIERPAMQQTGKVTMWIRGYSGQAGIT